MSDPRIENLLKRVEELERRVAQMVVRGKVHAVDPANKVARVAYGPRGQKQLTGWLPWKPSRTGKAIVWWCPEIGEGVTVVSDGDLSLGEILPGSYQNDFPAPSEDPDEFLIHFGDGSKVSHHREESRLTVVNKGNVSLIADGDVTAKAKGAVLVESEQAVTVKAASDMTLSTDANMELKAGGNMKLTASRIDFN